MRQAQNSPEKAPSRMPVLRIEPEKRLCPAFDPVTIATFPVAEPDEMGFRVLDNFCEEHIQCRAESARALPGRPPAFRTSVCQAGGIMVQ